MKKVLIYTPYEKIGHFSGWNAILSERLISLGMEVKFHKDFSETQDSEKNPIKQHDLHNFYNKVGLNKAIKLWSPDLVINTFFDSLNAGPRDWKFFRNKFPYKWSGIYFRPSISPGLFLKKPYYSKNFYGLQFVVEHDLLEFRQNCPTIRAGYLPDTCNTELPATLSPLAAKIFKLANGRKIIFMGGSIGHRKNILQWINLIKNADSKKYFFLQVGNFHYSEFGSRELNIIKSFMKNAPSNCVVIESYIANEKIFNELILISDCIFSVYKKFEASSNMIPKAAAFKIPILVNKDSRVMAQEVVQYNLGMIVPSANAKIILPYIEELFTNFDRKIFIKGCLEFQRYRVGVEFSRNFEEFFSDLKNGKDSNQTLLSRLGYVFN